MLKAEKGKRYWLKLELDSGKKEGILVILKNPSKANDKISDKTVFNVSNYIYKNRERNPVLEQVGFITIVNLMPHYLTDSSKLQELKSEVIDQKNLKTIHKFCKLNKKVIIAWGNHPKGLQEEYEVLKAETKKILTSNKNEVFYVDKLSAAGNPKHGQVWGYHNTLKTFKKA